MSFLYDYGAAAAVAGVCSLLAWLFGGTVASALLPTMPWAIVIMAEFALCFPQRHSGETTYEARLRVWRAIRHDPLLWLVLLFMTMMCIPFVNKGLCPCCDYPAIHFDGARAEPPIPYAPFCVNRMEHFNVLLWFLCAFSAMLATKHALLKRGKRMVLRLVVWNGVGLSAIGMIQRVFGAETPLWAEGWSSSAYFFSTFGYPNMGGDYFTTLFCLAIASWRWDVDASRRNAESDDPKTSGTTRHKVFWGKHIMLIPASIFYFSAMMTLSRAAILLVTALAIIFFAHALTSFLAVMSRKARVKTIAVNVVVLILIATFFLLFLTSRDKIMMKIQPSGFGDDLSNEISTIEGRGILDRMSGKGQYHTRVALAVWKDNWLFGCGGWGYKHFCIPKMSKSDFDNIQSVGGINVHNDYLQFLAEHGIVGCALLLVMFIVLLYPVFVIWKMLILASRFAKPKVRPPRPVTIFALPGGAFAVLGAVIATLLHGMADCPLRSPAVLTLFFVSLASIDGFLPEIRKAK